MCDYLFIEEEEEMEYYEVDTPEGLFPDLESFFIFVFIMAYIVLVVHAQFSTLRVEMENLTAVQLVANRHILPIASLLMVAVIVYLFNRHNAYFTPATDIIDYNDDPPFDIIRMGGEDDNEGF